MDEILEILEGNARISLDDLQKLTGKSKKDIERAMKSYEKKGVIVKYKTIINKQKIDNKGVVALIEVKVAPQKDVGFDAIAERIYRFPQARSVYLASGEYDLAILVVGNTEHEVADFVSQKLAPIEGVQGTVTHFILKRYKEDGEILEGKEEVRRQPVTF